MKDGCLSFDSRSWEYFAHDRHIETNFNSLSRLDKAMAPIAWIGCILTTAVLLWALALAAVKRYCSIDETTLSVFKLMLRHRGLDPSRFPNAALIDIIVSVIAQAKITMDAAVADRPTHSLNLYLFPLLDGEADLVAQIVRNGSEKYSSSRATGILLKYGVVEPTYPPAMSVEQFIEAANRGTLFAELDERVSKRD